MELKVMKPSCTVGTLAMGTASKGPRAIPAALQVTKAAGTTHQCQFSQLWLQHSTNQLTFSVFVAEEDSQQTMLGNEKWGAT